MSKPRYDWWPYMKVVVRDYPAMAANLPKENTTHRREYDAVREAMEATRAYPDGADRLRMVELAFWGPKVTLGSVAKQLECPRKAVEECCAEFIRLVASCYGLLD